MKSEERSTQIIHKLLCLLKKLELFHTTTHADIDVDMVLAAIGYMERVNE